MKRLHINRLKLDHFRNHIKTSVEVDQRNVVLFGQNGAGKTNLLEAVSFLSPGRGLRRATLDQLGNVAGDGQWTVFATLEGMHGEVNIGTGIQSSDGVRDTQRKVRFDGEPAKTSDELLEHLRVLWLTPAMDGLFTGSAGDRRKFLDRLVLAIDPDHGRRVSGFEKQMRARNRLLSENIQDTAWLDATEAQLAEAAVAIAAARRELVTLLSELIVRNNDPSSLFPGALLELSGVLEEEVNDASASDVETAYADRLRNARAMDAKAGRTLEGPHRSDLIVSHRPKMMLASLCSTGEQKALLTGLILAHARLVGEMAGAAPILLLDEIAAHLDEGRRAALYDYLDQLNCQTWMTGTDGSLFESLGNRAMFFEVEDGSVREV